LEESLAKLAESKSERRRRRLKLLGPRPKESTGQNYGEGKPLESASVVLGHEIGKEVIRLLIASGENVSRKEQRLSPKARYTIRIRI
jgi:hypothetical protein